MTGRRLFVHTLFLLVLPIIVAWFGVSVAGAVALVILALAWRWLITLSGLLAPEKGPDMELETISASHFVEKVRWCMDRLGIQYLENPWVGVLGAFTRGRSVPLLKIRTGIVRSTIGNSPEILRYLWGAYSASLGEKAHFLEPTSERLAFEQRLDRYGVDLQVWVYYHILDDRNLTQHAWGCNSQRISTWQRYTVIMAYPVLRFLMRKTFHITDAHYIKCVERIESLLSEIDTLLIDGRTSIMGDESISYVDISFAAFSGLWVQPPEYGGGMADEVRVDLQLAPVAMREDIERWTSDYPRAFAFVNHLYQQERTA